MTNSCTQNLSSFHHSIVEKLYSFIEENKLKHHDKLPPERVLAEMFATSRSTIRVVIKYLVEKGILVTTQGSGTYVADISIAPKSLERCSASQYDSSLYKNLLEFRAILEPGIAELAAKNRTQEQLDRLKVIVCDQQKKLVTGQGDGDLDTLFHQALAEASHNVLLVETMYRINQLYLEGRSDQYRDSKWQEFSIASHLKIIDAVERQSQKDCRKEVEEHIKTIAKNHVILK